MRATNRSNSGWPAELGVESKRFFGNRRRLIGSLCGPVESGGERAQARRHARAARRRVPLTRTLRDRTGALRRGERAEHAAEMTLPSDFAIASMSNAITRLAANSVAIETAPGSPTPSPGVCFSATAKARCVEAISVVRSGVTSPRSTDRPASINSAAITTSTSPGVGINANTGCAPALARRHLDIIDRRAGALRDARHRGGLRGPTLCLRERDDRIGEHASALSAHGDDRDRDAFAPPMFVRPNVAAVHARSLAKTMRPAFRRRSNQPIIEARVRRPTDPRRGIMDDLGAIERGTERRRLRDLAAIAATDATLVDRGDRIVLQRIVGIFD